MVDTVSRTTRSRMMAAVRQKDTAPEMLVRRLVHGMGYRYRLHVKGLPGKPDLVFHARSKVVFVNGCFWHGHDCAKGGLPKSNVRFWRGKIEKNRERDAKAVSELERRGWEVRVVWQCELGDRPKLAERLARFLDGESPPSV